MAVVLAILVSLLAVVGYSLHAAAALGEAESLALQAEKAAFVRSELELDADRVLQGTLQQEVLDGTVDPSVIEAALAQNFLAFMQQIQAARAPAVEFYSGSGPVDYAFLRNRFKVVVNVVNGVVFASFHNAAKDFPDSVNAHIRFGGATQSFSLPPNYTTEALKVGACVP